MIILYYILLIVFIIVAISSSKKKKQKTVHWPTATTKDPGVGTESDIQAAPASESFGEGESAEAHSEHLIGTDTEGEPETEHIRHMAEADFIEVNRSAEEPHASAHKPNVKSLRRAVIAREILDPPVSLRDRDF